MIYWYDFNDTGGGESEVIRSDWTGSKADK